MAIQENLTPADNRAVPVSDAEAAAGDGIVRPSLELGATHARELEAIGQLAGGIAHEFNNIVAACLMHLGFLQQSPQLAAGLRHTVDEVEAELNRASRLTRHLLLFSGRQEPRFKILDLNILARDFLKSFERRLGAAVEVVFQPAPVTPLARVDPGFVEQVLTDLCDNARDAMPDGGQLVLALAVMDQCAGLAAQAVDRSGQFVCLEVRDTGCGISTRHVKRIFEPFFTTKAAGNAIGLGLAIVHGIMEQHGGRVEVQSEVGRGSAFLLYFPLSAGIEGPEPAENEGPGEVRGGSETILLVEDDLSLRRSAALCLRKLGYGVLEASNGMEAMERWEGCRQSVQLLLTDMVMVKGMTGLELAARLRADEPGLKIIVCSGYSNELAKSDSFGANVTVLAKPFNPPTLARTVRQCLDENKAPIGGAVRLKGQTNVL